MNRTLRSALVALAVLTCAVSTATATSRIKDLASIEGIRQNQLIGYGLVVGLNGTGDTLNNSPFTKQSLQGMLERLGVNIRGQQIRTGNVAAVMVTANLPPFATQGTRIDVTASALGDSKSLLGGTLSGDAAPRRRRQRLRRGARLARDRRLPGRGRSRQGDARRADRRPAAERRDHRARDRIFAGDARPFAAGAAQRRFHHRQAHRHRGQRLYRLAGRRAARSFDRATDAAAEIPAKPRGDADRDRAAAGRAGRGGQDRDRRALRRHCHRPRCARLHGGGGAGQPHRYDFRSAASQPARRRYRAATRSSCRAPMSAWSRTARNSRSCTRACRSSRSSTG